MSMVVVLLFILIIALVVCFIMLRRYSPDITGKFQRLLIFTQAPWFADIKSGKKKIEARVGSPDYYKNHIGKVVKIGVPGGDKLKAKLTDVKHYGTLDEYIKKEGWKNVMPHVKSEKEAVDTYLAVTDSKKVQVYSPEHVKERGGIVALHFEILK